MGSLIPCRSSRSWCGALHAAWNVFSDGYCFVPLYLLSLLSLAFVVLLLTPTPLDIIPGVSSKACDAAALQRAAETDTMALTAASSSSSAPHPPATPLVDQVVFILVDALRPDYVHPDFGIDARNGQCERRAGEVDHLQQKTPHPAGPREDKKGAHRNVIRYLHESLRDPNEASVGFFSLADAPTTTVQRVLAIATGTAPQLLSAVVSNFVSPSYGHTVVGAASRATGMEEVGKKGRKDSLLWQLRGRPIFVGDDTWSQLFPLLEEASHATGNPPHAEPEYWKTAMGLFSYDIGDYHSVDQLVYENLLDILRAETRAQKNTSDPTELAPLVIGHVIGMDHVGHHLGAIDVPPMAAKALEYHTFLQNLTQVLEERDPSMSTLLVVMGDHGVTSSGNHGGGTHLERTTFAFTQYFAKQVTNGTIGSRARTRLSNSTRTRLETSIALRRMESLEPELQRLLRTCLVAPPRPSTLPRLSASSAEEVKVLGSSLHTAYPAAHKLSAVHQVDWTATIALLLGVPIPFHNLGRVIPEVIHLVVEEGGGPTEEAPAAVLRRLEYCNWRQMHRQQRYASLLPPLRRRDDPSVASGVVGGTPPPRLNRDARFYRRSMTKWSNFAHQHFNSVFSSAWQLRMLLVVLHVLLLLLLRHFFKPTLVLLQQGDSDLEGWCSLGRQCIWCYHVMRSEMGSAYSSGCAAFLQVISLAVIVLFTFLCTLRAMAYKEDQILCAILTGLLAVRTCVIRVLLPQLHRHAASTPSLRKAIIPFGFVLLLAVSPCALRSYTVDEVIPDASPLEVFFQRAEAQVQAHAAFVLPSAIPLQFFFRHVAHPPYVLTAVLWWCSSNRCGRSPSEDSTRLSSFFSIGNATKRRRRQRAPLFSWDRVWAFLCVVFPVMALSVVRGLPVVHHLVPVLLTVFSALRSVITGGGGRGFRYYLFCLAVVGLFDFRAAQRTPALIAAAITALLPFFFFVFCFDEEGLPHRLQSGTRRRATPRIAFFFTSLQRGTVVFFTAAYSFFLSGQLSTFATLDWQAAAVGLPSHQTTFAEGVKGSAPLLRAIARWILQGGVLPSGLLVATRNLYPLLFVFPAYRLASHSGGASPPPLSRHPTTTALRGRRSREAARCRHTFTHSSIRVVLLVGMLSLWGSTVGVHQHYHHINFVTILQLRYIYEFCKLWTLLEGWLFSFVLMV